TLHPDGSAYIINFRHTLAPALFPYTTLFRSIRRSSSPTSRRWKPWERSERCSRRRSSVYANKGPVVEEWADRRFFRPAGWRVARSEEHTSELQSRFDLVCRLLLETKNLH